MKQFGRTALLVLVLVAIWQALYLTVGETALASPIITAAKLAQLFRTPSFWGHVAETGHAFTYALVLSLLGGIGIGVMLGVNRTSGLVAEPQLMRSELTLIQRALAQVRVPRPGPGRPKSKPQRLVVHYNRCLLMAEKGFRRIQGYQHLAELIVALEQHQKHLQKNFDKGLTA